MKQKMALIIADDTTGANASGILLKSLGLSVYNVIKADSKQDDYDVATLGTGTRALESELAYSKVSDVLNDLASTKYQIYNKRVDSTLRGNISSELDAFFDYFKQKRKCIIVPSFPDSNRITNMGLLYVNDVLLENTEIAKDPKMPIDNSNVKELFQANSKLKYDNIYLSSLLQTDDEFQKEVITKLENCDALIIDALENSEIEFIARNICQLNIDVICVDPGPFTQQMMACKIKENKLNDTNLFIMGSVVDTAIMQLKYVNEVSDFELMYVDPKIFFVTDYQQSLDELIIKMNNSIHKNIVFTTTDINNPERLDLEAYALKLGISVDDASNYINDGLAQLAKLALNKSKRKIKNVFTSGGDVSVAFLNLIQATGLDLVDQIIPLAVHSRIVGGEFDKLNLVTKGGSIGSADTLKEIVEYMEEI